MNVLYLTAGAIAVISTLMAITRTNAVHAILYLIVSLLAVALIFFLLGAPFIAALEVIIYAGAIMVLFIFAVMMLNVWKEADTREKQWMRTAGWMGPSVLAAVLLAEITYLIAWSDTKIIEVGMVDPRQVGITLFGPYLVGVELASLLLLSGLVGAYHLGRRDNEGQREGKEES